MKPTDLLDTYTAKALESLGLWADANQKILRQLVDLSTAAADEGLRAYAELQTSALAAAKSGREQVLAQAPRIKEAQQDPVRAYQNTVAELLEGSKRAFSSLESNADIVAKSAERVRASAELAGREIQATLSSLGSQLKTVYAPADGAQA
jgi:hypothetical protein